MTLLAKVKRHGIRATLLIVCAALLAVAAGVAYLSSDGFQSLVYRNVISGMADATGGRLEIGSLHVSPWSLFFDAHDVTLHGREPRDATPLLHADHIYGKLRFLTLLGDTKAGLQSLTVERPQIHITILADGNSNLPVPPPRTTREKVQQMFKTVLGEVTLSDGELHWNDRTIPLQARARNVQAELSRSLLDHTFTGRIAADVQEARKGDLDESDPPLPGKKRMAVAKPSRPLVQGSAECKFTLGESYVRLDSFTMNTARSKLAANGVVKDLDDPKFEGTYDALVNLGEIGIGATRPKLAGGEIALKGDLQLSATVHTSTGKLALHSLDWRGDSADFNRIIAQGDYKFDGERVLLTNLSGDARSGRATGSGEILLAPNPAKASDRGRPAGSGRMHLKVEHLALIDVLDALKNSDTVAGRHIAGLLTGPVDVDWIDADHGEIKTTLAVQPPASVPEGMLGLTGTAAGTVTLGGVFRVEHLNLHSGASEVSAQGVFGEPGGLNLQLRSSEVAELRPLLVDLGWLRASAPAVGRPPDSQPDAISGVIGFDGVLAGTGQDPTIAGHLEAQHVLVHWPDSWAGERKASFDVLRSDLQFQVSELGVHKAELRMGAATIHFDAVLPLTRGDLNRNGPMTLHATVQGSRIEDLARIAGRNLPVRGTVQADLVGGGTLNDPQGEGSITLTDAVAQEVPVSLVSARLQLNNEELQFHNLQAALLQGSVTGEAALQIQTGALRYNVSGKGLHLGDVAALHDAPLEPSGMLDFTANGSGQPAAPVLHATLHVTDLVMKGGHVGDFTASIEPDPSVKTLRWLVHGDSNFAGPKLSIQGFVVPEGDWQGHLEARFSEVDIDPLLRTFAQRSMTGHSSVGGFVTVSGPLRRPADLDAKGTIDQFSAVVQNVKLQSDGPMMFHLANGQLELDRARLTGEGSNFSAGGTVSLRGDRKLDVTADGQINLHLIEAFYPELLTSGVVNTKMHVSGTLDAPSLQGRLQIEDASLSYVDLPSGLNHIKGSLLFNQDRLQVESLTAQTGAGELRLGGEIAYRNGLDFRLTATGKDVRLRYPPGLSATGDADLQMNGTPDNSTLSGKVLITRLSVSPRFDLGAYLAKTKQTTSTTSTPITGLKLNVQVTTVPELDFETGLGKLSGDADLRIQGTAGHPAVLGRINVVQGEVEIAGSTYRLEHGDIAFNNPVRIEPVLDLAATARVRDYDITMGLHGTPDKLTVNYRSDPPLPTSDIIALLALGRTRQDSGIVSNRPLSLDANTTNAILEQARNATASSRVQRLFGGARIKIDPQAGGLESSTSGARLTIEQQISNRLTLTYLTNVSQTQQQVIQVEYNLSRNVSLVGIRDSNSVVGFDVRVRQRRR